MTKSFQDAYHRRLNVEDVLLVIDLRCFENVVKSCLLHRLAESDDWVLGRRQVQLEGLGHCLSLVIRFSL